MAVVRGVVLVALTAAVLVVDGRSLWLRAIVGAIVVVTLVGVLVVDARSWKRTPR